MQITVQQAAKRLGVTNNTITNRIKKGVLKGTKQPAKGRGRGWRWLLDDAQLENGNQPSAAAVVGHQAGFAERLEKVERLVAEIHAVIYGKEGA